MPSPSSSRAARPALVVLAFSGGLDTTFCAAWLQRERGARVVTVTVDTGGFRPGELGAIEARARDLGVVEHRTVDAREQVWSRYGARIVQGHALRGGVYPLSVACERSVQAEAVVAVARQLSADAVAHGSTGAGNDQVRFDVACRALAPDLAVLAPVRELSWSREQERAWLAEHGVSVPAKTVAYSVNAGLFGTTIGGSETHDPWAEPPEAAWESTVSPRAAAAEPDVLVLGFERGLPVRLDGRALQGVPLLAALERLCRPHGIGRGVHVGDTILGLKGRIAFEAPAPLVLVEAHRELCKLVLTKWQSWWLEQAGAFWGMLLHEGAIYDPAARDLEALLDSCNSRVTGDVRVQLFRGRATVLGARSPESLFDPELGRYGEGALGFSGAEAAGFSKIVGLPSLLAARRDRRAAAPPAASVTHPAAGAPRAAATEEVR